MIPLLVAGAVIGLGARACASVDNSEAKEKNKEANKIIDKSKKKAQEAKTRCQNSISTLADEKASVLQGNMKRFVKSFSRIRPINFIEVGDLFEVAQFNRNELATIQIMVSNVQKVTVNGVVGGISGTALAVGAADMIAGGSLLSGVGISVGGLAGGAALGAVAAPVFAITGVFSASEAAANLEKAKSNLAKAKKYEDECKTYSLFAKGVSERCDLFYYVLKEVNATWFTDAVNQLEKLVKKKRTIRNFINNIRGKRIYTRQEMQTVASAASLAKMIRTIIDTNILDNKGHLTDKSKKVITEIKKQMDSGKMLPVENPEDEELEADIQKGEAYKPTIEEWKKLDRRLEQKIEKYENAIQSFEKMSKKVTFRFCIGRNIFSKSFKCIFSWVAMFCSFASTIYCLIHYVQTLGCGYTLADGMFFGYLILTLIFLSMNKTNVKDMVHSLEIAYRDSYRSIYNVRTDIMSMEKELNVLTQEYKRYNAILSSAGSELREREIPVKFSNSNTFIGTFEKIYRRSVIYKWILAMGCFAISIGIWGTILLVVLLFSPVKKQPEATNSAPIVTQTPSKKKKSGLSKRKITLKVGKTHKLKLRNKKGKVKWTSSNKKVASVSSSGKVKAKKRGHAKIKAKSGKKEYICRVTVK